MPTEVIKTIRASGGDYTSLSAWEAGEQRDLVAVDEIAVAECYNDWPDGLDDRCDIGGWTTDATRRIIIRAAAGQKHNGTPNTGFRMNRSNRNISLNDQSYVTIKDIELCGGAGTSAPLYINGGVGIEVDSIISKATESSRNALRHPNFSTLDFDGVVIRNCLFIGSGQPYNTVRIFRGVTVQNCTIDSNGNRYGINASNDCKVENVVSYGAALEDFTSTPTIANNNASSDATAPGASPIHNITSSEFTDYAANDYSLATGSQLIDAGFDLSSFFNEDINDEARSIPFDIGAFEKVSSAIVIGVLNSVSSNVSENVTIGQSTNIALNANSSAQSVQSSAVSIIQNQLLNIISSIQSVVSDEVILNSDLNLQLLKTNSAQASDLVSIAQSNLLSIVNTIVSIESENIEIVQNGVLNLFETTSGAFSSDVSISQNNIFESVKTVAAQLAESVLINQNSLITALDSINNVFSELASITGTGFFVISALDTRSVSTSEIALIAQNSIINIEETISVQISDSTLIVSSIDLAIINTTQDNVSETVQIFKDSVLISTETGTQQQSDSVSIFENLTIEAIETIQAQASDVIVLNPTTPGTGCGLTTQQNDMLVAVYNAITSTGARLSEQDRNDIAQKVWDETL